MPAQEQDIALFSYSELLDRCATSPQETYEQAKELSTHTSISRDPIHAAQLKLVLAYSGQFLGYHAEAFELANQALKVFIREKDIDSQSIAFNTLGFIYDFLNDYENRLKVNLKSLQLRKTLNDHTGYLRSLNNTGDTYTRLERYDEALACFDECYAEIHPDQLRLRAVICCNLGEVHVFLNNLDIAETYLLESAGLARACEFYGLLVNIAGLNGILENKRKNYHKTIDSLEEFIKQLEDVESSRDELPRLYKELGFAYESIGKTKEALDNYKVFFQLEQEIVQFKHNKEIRRIQFGYEISKLKEQKEALETMVHKRTVELEIALREVQHKEFSNRQILENASDAVIVLDQQGCVLDFNQRAQHFFTTITPGTTYLHELLEDCTAEKINAMFSSIKQLSEEPLQFRDQRVDNAQVNHFEVTLTTFDDVNETKYIAFVSDVTLEVNTALQREEDLQFERIMNVFSKSLLTENSIDGILWSIAKNCIAHLKFEECVVYLLNPLTNELEQKSAHGPKTDGNASLLNPITIPVGRGIVGTVAKTGQWEIIADTKIDPRYIVDDVERSSEIAVPIILNGHVIGVIDSEHSQLGYFTERHLKFLLTVAELVANRIDKLQESEVKERLQEKILIMNAQLEEQVEHKTHENTLLTHQIIDQEKKILIAELSNSIAHEMNTPIAIIKSSIELMSAQLMDLISDPDLAVLTSEDVNCIQEISTNPHLMMPRVDRPDKKMELEAALKTSYPEQIAQEITIQFAKSKFSLELFDILITTDNPLIVLRILLFIRNLNQFTSSIHSASNRMSQTVSNIKVISGEVELHDKIAVQLVDNMKTVIKHAKRSHQHLTLDWISSEPISLMGYPIKLIQLWNIIIGLLLENITFEDQPEINLCIRQEDDKKIVEFIVSQPVQLHDIMRSNWMDQLFSDDIHPATKLKLTILRTILLDHYAICTIDVTQEHVTVGVYFPAE
jgi:putative methionine-R-sulfoxide reductase with GAF domain/tetratricopeptide (TPR) repeat protein